MRQIADRRQRCNLHADVAAPLFNAVLAAGRVAPPCASARLARGGSKRWRWEAPRSGDAAEGGRLRRGPELAGRAPQRVEFELSSRATS